MKITVALKGRTIEVTLACSISGVTATDWTRNLSLHLASVAGSSFIACSNTIQLISYGFGHIGVEEWRTLDIDGAAGLDATRIRANTVARERQSSKIKLISRGMACGGHLLLGCSGLDLESRIERISYVRA